MLKEKEIIKIKAVERSKVDLAFLGVCFSLFTFIVAINTKIFQNNFLLALELTIAIPIFFSSIFASKKLAYTKNPKVWNEISSITFKIGYAFLISVVGILLSSLIDLSVGIVFFALNIVVTLIYSTLEVIADKEKLKPRIYRDLFFIFLIIIFGVLPSLGIIVWN